MYKDTIFLPKTEFPMKANLAQREPTYIEKWRAEKTYEMMRDSATLDGPYEVADGPPYANGDIHIGHALNKILKDILVKFYCMTNRKSALIPGWDCHGLPIELKVLGRKNVSDLKSECRAEAEKWIAKQKEQLNAGPSIFLRKIDINLGMKIDHADMIPWLKIREEVNKKIPKTPLDKTVIVTYPNYALPKGIDLVDLFGVSKVELKIGDLNVEVVENNEPKCARCWIRSASVDDKMLCARCQSRMEVASSKT